MEMNQCLVVMGVKWCKGFYRWRVGRERSGGAFSFFLLEIFCVGKLCQKRYWSECGDVAHYGTWGGHVHFL